MKKAKSVGWKFGIDAQTKFVAYCKNVGETAGDAASAAIGVWQHLPANIQRIAVLESKGIIPHNPELWKTLENALTAAVAHFQAGLKNPGQDPDDTTGPKGKRGPK